MRRSLKPLLVLAAALLAGGMALRPVFTAPADKDRTFLNVKKEIVILAVERVRAAPYEFERTLKMGEERLRQLHNNYQLALSTPPTALDADVKELRSATQQVRALRTRGRRVPRNPEADRLIEKYWEDYLERYERLKKAVTTGLDEGRTESQVYWDTMKTYKALREDTQAKMLSNKPPGHDSLGKILERNEWALLKMLEASPRVTKGPGTCVVAPGEHPHSAQIEVAPFYQSQGLLPTQSPRGMGSFMVPQGCRTVTMREAGATMIFRVSRGRGVAYIGSAEKELVYGYMAVPPDTAYYFENTGDIPLDLEYVALPPQ